MPKTKPSVSVIIPTYNRAHLLGQAIQSVLDQTYQNFEIIVVDDGSANNTEEIVKVFNDPRICYIRHEKNRGGSAARNTGIKAARGEYIAFLDSDDEWLPEKLEKQLKVFKDQDLRAGVVYTRFIVINENGDFKITHFLLHQGYILKELLISNCVGTTSTVMVKRECFEKVGGFDENLPSCQDWDMWIRIAKHYTFKRISKPLVKYTLHQKQISNNFEAVWRGHMAIMEKYEVDICALGRRVEAYHHFRLGNYLCHAGEMRQGRQHLFRAVVKCPWRARYSAYALASLFGASGFRCLALAKRIIGRLLNIFVNPWQRRSCLRRLGLSADWRETDE